MRKNFRVFLEEYRILVTELTQLYISKREQETPAKKEKMHKSADFLSDLIESYGDYADKHWPEHLDKLENLYMDSLQVELESLTKRAVDLHNSLKLKSQSQTKPDSDSFMFQ